MNIKNDNIICLLKQVLWELSAECGARSEERGATLARVRNSLTECGVRNAERLCFVYYANKDIIKNFLTDKNALVWMLAKAKVKPRRVAVLTYCALTGFWF